MVKAGSLDRCLVCGDHTLPSGRSYCVTPAGPSLSPVVSRGAAQPFTRVDGCGRGWKPSLFRDPCHRPAWEGRVSQTRGWSLAARVWPGRQPRARRMCGAGRSGDSSGPPRTVLVKPVHRATQQPRGARLGSSTDRSRGWGAVLFPSAGAGGGQRGRRREGTGWTVPLALQEPCPRFVCGAQELPVAAADRPGRRWPLSPPGAGAGGRSWTHPQSPGWRPGCAGLWGAEPSQGLPEPHRSPRGGAPVPSFGGLTTNSSADTSAGWGLDTDVTGVKSGCQPAGPRRPR